jgi:hypothetical protein
LANLEDHLHLVPTPLHQRMLRPQDVLDDNFDDNHKTKDFLRPTTAFRSKRRRQSVTLELYAENNTLLRIESGSNNKITRIMKTNISVGELVKTTPKYLIHQGSFDDLLINIIITKLKGNRLHILKAQLDRHTQVLLNIKIQSFPEFFINYISENPSSTLSRAGVFRNVIR